MNASSAQQVFDVFSGSKVIEKRVFQKKGHSIQIGEWKPSPVDPNVQERKVHYQTMVGTPIVPATETLVEESHLQVSLCHPWIMEIHSVAPKMPYSSDFIPMMRYCITEEEGKVRLRGSVWIRWLHKPLLIQEAVLMGLKSTCMDYVDALKDVVSQGVTEESSGWKDP
jgi:hypothetical protein